MDRETLCTPDMTYEVPDCISLGPICRVTIMVCNVTFWRGPPQPSPRAEHQVSVHQGFVDLADSKWPYVEGDADGSDPLLCSTPRPLGPSGFYVVDIVRKR